MNAYCIIRFFILSSIIVFSHAYVKLYIHWDTVEIHIILQDYINFFLMLEFSSDMIL